MFLSTAKGWVMSTVSGKYLFASLALRLKIEQNKIQEAEAVVVRIAGFSALDGGVNPFAAAKFVDKPILQGDLAASERRPRERLVAIANGYFDTLQLNDGTLFTQFDPVPYNMPSPWVD